MVINLLYYPYQCFRFVCPFGTNLRVVGADKSLAIGTVMVQILARVHTVGDAHTGPAPEKKFESLNYVTTTATDITN